MHKKIAFIGSVGSGKTTLIENLSSMEILKTDVKTSVEIGKELTTVGIDYGHVVIDSETTLGLYGVPGQRKFSLVWDFVKKGLWAVVILVKNNDLASIDEMDYLVNYFEINQGVPCVIGITHSDLADGGQTLAQVRNKLIDLKLKVPVYTIDCRLSASARLIMETIIAIDESV